MNAPTVSVIIPAYNAAGTIARALQSVYAQSSRDYEVIIVDDGSTDDLDAALQPYRARLRLIRQRNQGASAARNAAVRAAAGRFVAFLDSDDFWHPRKLELQLAAFAQRGDLLLCWTGHGYWQPGWPWPDFTLVPGDEQAQYSCDFERVFLAPYLGTPGVMMPTGAFQDLGGFREDLQSAEDIDLWLRAAYRGSTALIRGALFYVVAMPGSLTAQRRDGTYEDNLRVISDFCAAHPLFLSKARRTVRKARAKVYEDWGSSALAERKFAVAARLLRRSLGESLGARAAYLWTKAVAGSVLRS